MPEGDTVFLAAHRLREALAGQKLTHADLRHPRLSTVDLTGRTVTDVVSVGKHLFLRFDDGRSLHSHLRMDGSWQLYEPGQRWRRPGHQARAVLATSEWTAVGFRLHDMALFPTARESDLVGHLGDDLLDPAWSGWHETETLQRLRARSDATLGEALLDQRVVAGIGNIYRAETCFLAALDPRTPVTQLSDDALLGALRIARKLLVRNRLRPGQNTTGDRRRGRTHWVYGRASQPCLRCGTTVRSAEIGIGLDARPVWFCPRCQPQWCASDIG